jgi:hypothetical protein
MVLLDSARQSQPFIGRISGFTLVYDGEIVQ